MNQPRHVLGAGAELQCGCASRHQTDADTPRQAEIEKIEATQAQAAHAQWPPTPDTTENIQRLTRELRLCDVPRDIRTSRQPPAAGLMTQHQDVYYIPPPRVVGGARGNSAPVSTATLGLIQRQDPSLVAQLREDPGSMMTQATRRTSLQHHAPHQDWHVGPVGFPPTMGRGDASPR